MLLGTGWGGVLSLPSYDEQAPDYWTSEQSTCDIATREAVAVLWWITRLLWRLRIIKRA